MTAVGRVGVDLIALVLLLLAMCWVGSSIVSIVDPAPGESRWIAVLAMVVFFAMLAAPGAVPLSIAVCRVRRNGRVVRGSSHAGVASRFLLPSVRVCVLAYSPAPGIPLPPAVGRAIDRAVENRARGPILLNLRGRRMDRHCATRRLRRLAEVSVVRLPKLHPHMLRHTFVTTMLDAGVDLRDVQIAARHADPRTTMRYDRARTNLDRHPNYILAAYMASAT
ncbi:tyrosine-type recombinase/integrase [Nocardia sp. NPDC052278]|uniref:tyrosine-type recombinase/integrase n=1 Tax=unclassified Nocardia TaxID=2637762 RepID=UPI00368EA99A